MFIIQDGIVEVLDFEGEDEIIYATLTQGMCDVMCDVAGVTGRVAGQYFGELALLSLTDIGSRRTAYVRAVGYVEVFVMHKEDLKLILASDSSLRFNLANRASKLLGNYTNVEEIVEPSQHKTLASLTKEVTELIKPSPTRPRSVAMRPKSRMTSGSPHIASPRLPTGHYFV